jgi:hypothetical protein
MLKLNESQKNSIMEYLANRKLLSELYQMPETEENENLITKIEMTQVKKLNCIDSDLATEIIINGDDIIKKLGVM